MFHNCYLPLIFLAYFLQEIDKFTLGKFPRRHNLEVNRVTTSTVSLPKLIERNEDTHVPERFKMFDDSSRATRLSRLGTVSLARNSEG